jgi:hypothetical protein
MLLRALLRVLLLAPGGWRTRAPAAAAAATATATTDDCCRGRRQQLPPVQPALPVCVGMRLHLGAVCL